ncbi:hypothetical protein QBC37DRAFT_483654 [Rhypophila decipiens]|uniref:Uncharacterized protein n=1 Tax=Rhypophila decipiens TaxID=261697 RepID=A0AAN6Y5M7_9PEZI|nr:hypothetical protein QBC37DRAFT_483654 [Rhypophila decipiens]
MSSTESLLTREQRPLPATPTRPYSEELGAPPLPTIEKDKPTWISRFTTDVVSDLRSTQWKTLGKWYLLGFWTYCLFTTAVVLPVYLYLIGMSSFPFEGLIETGLRSPGCLPNDAFDARSTTYNIFDPSGFFQITHGFGDLTFTQVKVIDLIWDIMVGRGGQTMLAYFSWKAFSTYFWLSMSTQPITYNSFWAIFLDRQPSLVGIYRVIRDFVSHQARRSKSIMIFVPFSMLFVLVFPIMMSAMTGYRPNLAGFVADTTNSLIPFEKFVLAAYVLHDGERVGYGRDFVVPFMFGVPFFEIRKQMTKTLGRSEAFQLTDDGYFAEASVRVCEQWRYREACELPWNVSQYVEQYGFYGLDNKTGKPAKIRTTWKGEFIPEPSLNISAFYIPPGSYFGHGWTDPETKTTPFADSSNLALNIQGTNTLYTLDYVQEHGSCQQQKSYQWGFSFLQVFLMAILLLIWTSGTYFTWLKAHKTLEKQVQLDEVDKEVPSEFKSALTFASTVQFEMAMAGKEKPELSLTNGQLHSAIQRDLHGGRIMSTTSEITTNIPEQYNPMKEIWSLCKRRWFIFPALVFTTLCMTTLVLLPIMTFFVAGAIVLIPLHTGFVFAISIGSTSRSRGFFAWAGFIGMLIGAVVGLMVITRGGA